MVRNVVPQGCQRGQILLVSLVVSCAAGAMTAISARAGADEPTRSVTPSPETTLFERFLEAREQRMEAEMQPLFERFLRERPNALAKSASDAPRAGIPSPEGKGSGPALSGASASPSSRARTSLLQPSAAERGVGRTKQDAQQSRIDLTSLQGEWCSNLIVYEGLPPLEWAIISPDRVRISFPLLAGEHRGTLRTKEAVIEALADGTVRLVEDNPAAFAETVYGVERRALRGVSYRRVDKRTSVEKISVPDSFRRCDTPP